MTIVLKKSTGAFSAGTPVLVLDRDSRHKYNLCRIGDTEMHLHDDELVKRRNATDIFTTTPRWLRRQSVISSSEQESSQETGTIIRF
jgi:hypothetical protein